MRKKMIVAALAFSLLSGCAPASGSGAQSIREQAGTVTANWEKSDQRGMEVTTEDGSIWVVEGMTVSIGTNVTVAFNTAGTDAIEDDSIIGITIE